MKPQNLLPFAKKLRTDSTDAERVLWRHLRAKRFDGCKFRRQQPIGWFIVDFVCLEKRLIVELDGGQHMEQAAEDAARDAWLKAQGSEVLRFWNSDVFGNLEGVLLRVLEHLSPSPQPSPVKGEGVGGGDQNPSPLTGEGQGVRRGFRAACCPLVERRSDAAERALCKRG